MNNRRKFFGGSLWSNPLWCWPRGQDETDRREAGTCSWDVCPCLGERSLTLFRAELLSHGPANSEELFEGCTVLRAITFSSSVEFLLRLAERLDDMEVVFGAERILSREHLALAQASHAVQAYGFADAFIDHKALTEALGRLLGRSGRALLDRVVEGTLRFRLLRGRPSHEKLFLLSGPSLQRVLTSSANLSAAAFKGRQGEVHVAFDSPAA